MIDYVIISSDDNPTYKDFYPIVSKRWNDIGWKTYFINISNEDSITDSDFGIIHKVKKLDFVSTAFQSQVVRLFAANFLEDSVLMTSDIDMLPISENYFKNHEDKFNIEKISVCSGQPYIGYPYYPMCYIIAYSNLLRNVLGIEGLSFSDFCSHLVNKYGQNWNTDEKFMYDMFQRSLDKITVYERGRDLRIDRVKWSYSIDKINSDYYIDSHLLRPYGDNKTEIDKLILSL